MLVFKTIDYLIYSSTIVAQKPTKEKLEELLQMAEYSANCYSSKFKIPDAVFCQSEKTDSEAYIWTTETELYIAFRGTEDPKDVLYNLDARTTTMDPGVCVHNGFHTQFYSIEPLLTLHLEKYTQGGGKRVILVGHSLGGALANIASYYYTNIYPELDIWTYTFGSPRVGNITFAQHKCHLQGYRVYNYQDPVPMVPMSFRFEHVQTSTICLTSDTSKYTESDVPWYYRVFSLLRLNLIHPIQTHYSSTYVNMLNKLVG